MLIRTVTATGGWWQLPVGGSITYQSNPEDEFRETWHQAGGSWVGRTAAECEQWQTTERDECSKLEAFHLSDLLCGVTNLSQ
ncbi:MAG: hypothetical protein RH917_14585 [Lacipirellulaceae bacterium]